MSFSPWLPPNSKSRATLEGSAARATHQSLSFANSTREGVNGRPLSTMPQDVQHHLKRMQQYGTSRWAAQQQARARHPSHVYVVTKNTPWFVYLHQQQPEYFLREYSCIRLPKIPSFSLATKRKWDSKVKWRKWALNTCAPAVLAPQDWCTPLQCLRRRVIRAL